ncbi:MAG: polysaccharide biosynthesis C-terminal domain-containing protein [Alphaproteobacteria bacterium]|nr:polysaccharide biosynthesis C-terminal domain-containing protein [Alphaproteobacteria bacterium]
MNIQLAEHFTYQKLLRFTAPSILMIIFTSVYCIVDGWVVSNFIGATAFAAISIIAPFSMILGTFGFMISSGGCALVAKTLGEQSKRKANVIFSLIIYSTIIIGIFIGLCGVLLLKPLLVFLGTDNNLTQNCLTYGYIIIPAIPFFILQVLFPGFLITAERPKLGLFITVSAGITNAVLDVIFIIFLHKGLAGAAWATTIGQAIGGLVPLIYFIFPNKTSLRLGKTKFNIKVLIKTYTNGLSEFLGGISGSIVGTLYNYQLIKIMGESGVVALGIIGYVNFIFLAIFLGYNQGSAPIISYHFGAKNYKELQNLFKKSLFLIAMTGCLLFMFAELHAKSLANMFVSYDSNLLDVSTHGLRVYSISFLLVGINLYASSFFTALNNGVVSAIISTLRTFVFEGLCIMVLPIYFGINGVWSAIIVVEVLSLLVSCFYFITLRKKYKYY